MTPDRRRYTPANRTRSAPPGARASKPCLETRPARADDRVRQDQNAKVARQADVLVLGGGQAGLAMAHALKGLRAEVHVLEVMRIRAGRRTQQGDGTVIGLWRSARTAGSSTTTASAPPGGRYVIGLPWLRTTGSALLGFVGRDAAYLAKQVAASSSTRARAPELGPEGVRGRPTRTRPAGNGARTCRRSL